MLVYGVPTLNFIDPSRGIRPTQLYSPLQWNMLVYGIPTLHFIDPVRGICLFMESLHSTVFIPLVEYASSWSPYNQLY